MTCCRDLFSNILLQTDGKNFIQFVFCFLSAFFFWIGLGFQTVPQSLNEGHQWTKKRANKRVKWACLIEHLPQARDWVINGPRKEPTNGLK